MALTAEGPVVFTTGQIGRLCGAAPRTVAQWIDSGKLKGYRLPGSEDRRVPRKNLIQFLRASGMTGALNELERGHTILFVNCPGRLAKDTLDVLDANAEAAAGVVQAESPFEAGVLYNDLDPPLVITYLSGCCAEYRGMARWLAAQEAPPAQIALLPEDMAADAEDLGACGFGSYLQMPVLPGALAAAILNLLHE